MVVGAPFDNSGIGAAYVFTGSGTHWSEVQELTPSDGRPKMNSVFPSPPGRRVLSSVPSVTTRPALPAPVPPICSPPREVIGRAGSDANGAAFVIPKVGPPGPIRLPLS